MATKEQLEQWHQEDLERLKNFRLMDDDFMTKCFEGDPKYIQFVLRIILEMPELEVKEVHTQRLLANLLDHSVRMDVLAVDGRGRRMNVEVQRESKGAGRKRARYYSGMMDGHLLEKSTDFDILPDTYMIFITERDVLRKGRPIYHIDRRIRETGESFGDGTHIIYVNGAYRDESPLGKLMHDFSCADPSEMNYDVLAERVRFFKESKEGVGNMCKAMEDMRDKARKEALKEGLEKGRKEMVLAFLRQGKFALEDIASASGFSLDEIKKMQAAQNA